MRCSAIIRNSIGLLSTVAACMAGAADVASFDTSTNILTMPLVKIDGNTQIRDVRVRLLDFGQLQLDDPGIGSQIEFLSGGNVLRLPQVSLAGVTYPRVSLSNPTFTLESFGSIVVDGGTQGNYRLEVQVTAMQFSVPPIIIENVPKPATQDEFCNDPSLRDQITQATNGMTGTWTMNSCSFNGTVGQINMTLTTPYFSLPYSATYTYR
jgi:hypothetical protein